MKLKSKTKMIPLRISWDEYLNLVQSCINKLEVKPDYIFAPIRGGLIPAVIFSHSLNIKIYAMEPDELEKTIHPRIKKDKIVLFIDDIFDSGATAKKCVKYLEEHGYINIITCAITLKATCNFFVSIHGRLVEKNEYVIFPYENEDIEMENIKGAK